MCEQGSDVLKRTIPHIEEKFGKYLYNMKWINLGGGHHITRDDYDLDTLIECVNYLHDKYGVQVYLEPGEAVALNAGYLVSEVIDTAKTAWILLSLTHQQPVICLTFWKCLTDRISSAQGRQTKSLTHIA